jgi:hypothetical protein
MSTGTIVVDDWAQSAAGPKKTSMAATHMLRFTHRTAKLLRSIMVVSFFFA